MAEFLPYGKQTVEDDDAAAVARALSAERLTTGPLVEEFERRLAEAAVARHAVAVNSGTSALHAAYAAAGIGPGDEVVVPSLTFCATANAARHLGATVRFADVDPRTLTMDPESARRAATAATRVVAPVDFAGHPADVDALRDLAPVVVHDAAHGLGAQYGGRPAGSLAPLTCFSFHPVKAITTGEGGAVTTDDAALAERMRRFRSHGQVHGALAADPGAGAWAYDVEEIGHNYRITDLQCALGLSQLAKLGRFLERRRAVADGYRERLEGVRGLKLPVEEGWARHAWHLFVVRVPAGERRRVFDGLRAAGIGAQVHYIPVNMLRAYRKLGCDPEETPVALQAYREMISLPCFPAMEDEDVERVARVLTELLR